MDPFSHVVLGRVLVRAQLRQGWMPGLGWAAGLGALSPDVDAVVMAFGFDRYLVAHQAGTHSVTGAILCAGLAAGLVRRWTRGLPYWPLALAACVGALSHLAADLLAGGALKPAWPFNEGRLSDGGLVAMGDPWVIGVLALGILAQRALRTTRVPVAALVLAALAALLTGKLAMRERALASYTGVAGAEAGDRHIMEAVWGSLTRWHVYDASRAAVRAWHVDGWTGDTRLLLDAPREAWGAPELRGAVSASRGYEIVQNFLDAHRLALVRGHRLADGGQRVLWSDVRYCREGSTDSSRVDASDAVQCSLWVGVELAASGALSRQLVLFGERREHVR